MGQKIEGDRSQERLDARESAERWTGEPGQEPGERSPVLLLRRRSTGVMESDRM